ncbi:MAG: outer membrane protein assembly factor BamD [Candidatus Krumholzibacteria bacterium]|nr:outer membrane protein assembly factor BamD [Candidatus Krumholzibacteria bacterium]
MFKIGLGPCFPDGSWIGISILLLMLAGLGGCGASNPHPVGSYERGVFFADQGKDVEAVAALESYIRKNPVDSLAAEAQYLKGLTYMEMGEYPLAGVEFQILRKDYPTSIRVEDALFQEGVSYLEQVGKVQRDITGAHEARLHFLKFSQQYPNSPHMPEVVAYMEEISDLMVHKRLEQIKIYKQLHRYEAVAITLDDVLLEESGSSYIPDVMWERARAAEKLDDPDTAARMYERLVTEYPDSRYTNKASKALRSLDEEEYDEEED